MSNFKSTKNDLLKKSALGVIFACGSFISYPQVSWPALAVQGVSIYALTGLNPLIGGPTSYILSCAFLFASWKTPPHHKLDRYEVFLGKALVSAFVAASIVAGTTAAYQQGSEVLRKNYPAFQI